MKSNTRILYSLALYFFTTSILACPICNSDIGKQVRAEIFNHHFWLNLFYTVLPFVFFTIIAIVSYHGLPIKRSMLKQPYKDVPNVTKH